MAAEAGFSPTVHPLCAPAAGALQVPIRNRKLGEMAIDHVAFAISTNADNQAQQLQELADEAADIRTSRRVF
jgi:hypothetical protein